MHLHLESDQNYSRFAIVADGPTHTHGELDNGLRGVYRTLRIGRALDACAFLVVDDGTLVCKDDTRMWLESDHGRKEPDTTVLLWGVDCVPEKHEWAKKYVFEKDGTIAPAQNPHGVCLGVQEDEHATDAPEELGPGRRREASRSGARRRARCAMSHLCRSNPTPTATILSSRY